MVADLMARVFGELSPHALLPAVVAPIAALGSTSTTAADAAVDAAAPAPTSPPSTGVENDANTKAMQTEADATQTEASANTRTDA
ncbi:hypothetical protein MRB53_026579 [Persea americana]|uniref:Uncharacterized protein n=1 Tax=Persea americana TaxID=3435 RepID=A0ACC2LJ81_PERAE|nr:hypothetical protein MRB53_026579 [Persea americana]